MSKTIVFDLDGTLIDSAPDLHDATNVMLAALGRGPLDLATVISFIGNGVEKLVERALEATGGDDGLKIESLSRFRAHYDANMTRLTRPYEGVLPCLEALAAQGCVLGICTNKPDGPAKAICADLGIAPLFGVIAGARPGIAHKPDPEPLLASIAALGGLPETALYVGDSRVDWQTAQNAGVAFRLFSGGYMNGPAPAMATGDVFDRWSVAAILG